LQSQTKQSKSKQGVRLRDLNTPNPDLHVAGDHVPAVQSKRELKTWDELTLRSREARLKLGVDHLRAALETLREIVGMCDEDLQPSSLDELLAAVLEKGVEHSVQPLSLSHKSVPGVWAEKIIAKAMKNLEHEHRVVMLDGWSGLLVGHGLESRTLIALRKVLPPRMIPTLTEINEHDRKRKGDFVSLPSLERTLGLGVMQQVVQLLSVQILEVVIDFIAPYPEMIDAFTEAGEPFRVVVQLFGDGFACPKTFDGGMVGHYLGVYLITRFGGKRLIDIFNCDQVLARLRSPAGKQEFMVCHQGSAMDVLARIESVKMYWYVWVCILACILVRIGMYQLGTY